MGTTEFDAEHGTATTYSQANVQSTSGVPFQPTSGGVNYAPIIVGLLAAILVVGIITLIRVKQMTAKAE